MKKLNILKEEAPELLIGCMTASLREGNETQELFARSWLGRISPLVWRVPILLWSCVIISLSIVTFWGPREKFLLYMTHWGLLLIFWESLFGVIVTVKKTPESLSGKPKLLLYNYYVVDPINYFFLTDLVNFPLHQNVEHLSTY